MKRTLQFLGLSLSAATLVACQPADTSAGKARAISSKAAPLKFQPGDVLTGADGSPNANGAVVGRSVLSGYFNNCTDHPGNPGWSVDVGGTNDVRVVKGDSGCQLVATNIDRYFTNGWFDSFLLQSPITIQDGYQPGSATIADLTNHNWLWDASYAGSTMVNIAGSGMNFESNSYSITLMTGRTEQELFAVSHTANYDYSQVTSVVSEEWPASTYTLSNTNVNILTDLNHNVTRVEGTFTLNAGNLTGEVYVLGSPRANFDDFLIQKDAQRYATFKGLVDQGGAIGQQATSTTSINAADLFPVGTNIAATPYNYVLISRQDAGNSNVVSYQLLGITAGTAASITGGEQGSGS